MERPEPPITRRLVLKDKGFEFVDDPPLKQAEERKDSSVSSMPRPAVAEVHVRREAEPSAGT